MLVPKVSVVLGDGCLGAAVAHLLSSTGLASQVRSSPVLDDWDGLSDVSYLNIAVFPQTTDSGCEVNRVEQ